MKRHLNYSTTIQIQYCNAPANQQNRISLKKKHFSSVTLPNERVPDKRSFSVYGWLLLLQGLCQGEIVV